MRRTSGESGPEGVSGSAGRVTAWAITGATGSGLDSGSAAGWTGTAAAVTLPLEVSSIRATTVLMATVLPSSTRISATEPAAGAGISVSTLSVEISNSASSFSIRSPGFLSHLVSVPSTMLSPICGITTSIM